MSAFCSLLLFYTISIFIPLFGILLLYFKYAYSYWARKNVPYLKPKFPMGNKGNTLPQGISFGTISANFYKELKSQGHRYGGVYTIAHPYLVIVDPTLVKQILAKDFQHFSDRGLYKNKKLEPMLINIFTQDGQLWKNMRMKLTPGFTSNRVKLVYQHIVNCAKGMKEQLTKLADRDVDIDLLEIAACYTTDVIGTAIYGLEFGSLKGESEFRRMGYTIFSRISLKDRLNLFVLVNFPIIARFIGLRLIPTDVSNFFEKCFMETVVYRKANNISRPDFFQLLMDLMAKGEITLEELVAQAFFVFQAGFESSAKTIFFSLLELAKAPELQERARNEIQNVVKKFDNELPYDCLGELKYLQQCIDETLRLWPSLATIPRICTKDCELGDTGLVVEKGTGIMISALALHKDPDYFPDPEKFDPERFNEQNKRNIVPGSYLPFGDGPRICIGMRLALIQSKLGIATVLRNFKVNVSKKTKFPIKLNPETFITSTMDTIYLKLEKI